MTELTSEQLAGRYAAQQQRATDRLRTMEDRARGQLTPGQLAPGRRRRQAYRRGVKADMSGYVAVGGGPLVLDEHGRVGLDLGSVATRSPTVDGVVPAPELAVTPGLSYVLRAVLTGPRAYLGLQWITVDGLPHPDIEWNTGPASAQLVLVTGIAPPNTRGARSLIVAHSTAPPHLRDKDPETVAIQQQLAAWRTGHGQEG